MNPTSSGTQSPRYTSPNISPSAQEQELTHSVFLEQMQWIVEDGCTFPVYTKNENEKFRKKFDQCIKEVSLQLQSTMACLSEIAPDKITTSWEAFSTLVSCLGSNLPKHIPLSIFTSITAVTCTTVMERSPPAKKRKPSDSSDQSDLRNKSLATAQKLASTIRSTLSFLKESVQLTKLQELNTEKDQTHRAFHHAISQRLAVESSIVLDNAENDLAERIISAINPKGDTCSYESKFQLLLKATKEFVRAQETLVNETFLDLARKKNPLPINGTSLLASCIQHSDSSIRPSANMEGLPSWKEFIFCYLARAFLQKNNVPISHQTESNLLLIKLQPYFPLLIPNVVTDCSDAIKQSVVDFLAQDFVQVHSEGSSEKQQQASTVRIRYNNFLKCFLSITHLLKGLFILETRMDFSPESLSVFQEYAQALHFPNTTTAINTGIQEAASLCAEEHQKNLTCTRLLLEKTNILLHNLMFQSLAITVVRKQAYQNKKAQDLVPCTWMPEELKQSILFCSYWEEAKWTYHSGKLFVEDFPKILQDIEPSLNAVSHQLRTTFLRLCYNLFMDVLKEMPLECSETPLEAFLAKARELQTNMIPKHASISRLFTIGIKHIAKSKDFEMRSMLLELAKQDFFEGQKAFVESTCNFLLQNKIAIPLTEQALLSYCKEQYKGNMRISASLEKLPFWKERIFLCLAYIFLQRKHPPGISCLDKINASIEAVTPYFPIGTSQNMPISKKLDFFIKALAEELFSMNFEPTDTAEHTTSATIMFSDTEYENCFQSASSLKTLITAFFKIDTGKSLSQKNLRAFHKYANELLSRFVNIEMQTMISESLIMCMEETQQLNESPEEITDALTKMSVLLEKLLHEALMILTLRKHPHKKLSLQASITAAFRIICSETCVPITLLSLKESETSWKNAVKNFPKEAKLSRTPNNLDKISKKYTATAIELTNCFLTICQNLLSEISHTFLLEFDVWQFPQTSEEFTERAHFIYPRITLEDHHPKFAFKELVSFLAKDRFQANDAQTLMLAIENFLKAQESFLAFAYTYLLEDKLTLPITGTALLKFFKKQYPQTINIPRSLTKLPSWKTLIFYSLARIFLLEQQKPIAVDSRPWNVQPLVNGIMFFFPKAYAETKGLPLENKLEAFTNYLEQHFSFSRTLNAHDTEPQTIEINPSACQAYDHFLQSSLLLKKLFRTCFTIKTGNDSSSQGLQELQAYIESLLINEPEPRRTNILQDVFVICSEEEDAPTTQLSQLCSSLNHANSLIKHLMEVSLAFVMLKGNPETELTPKTVFEIALKEAFSESLETVPQAFLNSSSGMNALLDAMNAHLSGTLCLQIVENFQLSSEQTEANPLQTAIETHLSGQACPQIDEYVQLLSSEFLSTKEALTILCKKLYIDMKANVISAISEAPSEETPLQTFVTTANACHNKMILEEHTTMPLLQSLVLILAHEYENEVQSRSEAVSDESMKAVTETSATEDETNVAVCQEIKETTLTEKTEIVLEQESQRTITQGTETEQSLEELDPNMGYLLSAEDFQNLLEGKPVSIEAKNFTNLREEEVVPVEAEDFTDLLEQCKGFAESFDQEITQFEEETQEEEES